MSERYRSFADPVHGVIKFDKQIPVEALALDIIDTRAFQRLRNIKQLGITSEIYPSATHTRFSHSLGTFCITREICDIIEKQGYQKTEEREIALISALLHDIGHGPQSHIFETISKKYFNLDKSHETWGSEIITQYPEIRDKLEKFSPNFSKKVASYLLMSKKDRTLYSSIISSSLDADRMDYLLRDRNASGVSGCNIDKIRILNSINVINNPLDGKLVLGIKSNGLDAVEEFLRSRVYLYHQIYNHRREQAHILCMGNLFEEVSKKKYLLDDKYSPLEKLLKGDHSIDNYLETTDADMIRLIARLYKSDDKRVSYFADRVLDRSSYRCAELSTSIEGKEDVEMRIDQMKKIAASQKGSFVQDKTIRAYDPKGKDFPIYIVYHRDGYKVRELSEVSNIANEYKRVVRAFTPRKEAPTESFIKAKFRSNESRS